MSLAQTRLLAVGEEHVPELVGTTEQVPEPERKRAENAFTGLLLMSLKALSQRAVIAFAALEGLLLIGSAFALWLMIISNPTPPQLVAVGGYALFVLFALWMRKR